METPLSSEIENGISIGNAVEIYDKVIYPVARISVLRSCGNLLCCWIAPIALLITEPNNFYAISLTNDEITLDQLLVMAPSLNEIVDGHALGNCRS
jgi:hypothetical protein